MRIRSVKYSTGRVSLTSHNHDTHQILFIKSGKIAVTLDGVEEIVDEGSILILSRFEEHSVKVLTPEYNRYMLLVSSEPSPTGNENYLLSSVLVNRAKGFRHIINTGEKSSEFEEILCKMRKEYTEKESLADEQLDLLFNSFLISLYRISPEIFTNEAKVNTSVVEKIQGRFERDYNENFSLSGLAAEYHISMSHLAHIFKAVTGYSPIDYLTVCRLTAAKSFLSTTSKPIKEIVDICGFGDESNFSRMFRTKIGITPSEYRKQNSVK